MKDVAIISGRSNEPLAQSIAQHLRIPLTPILLDTFSSGENQVEILRSVRNRQIYIIQSACTYESDSPSPNDYIMETVMMADACFRASAEDVVLVLPALPYTEEFDESWTIDADEIVCQTDLQRFMKETIFPSSSSSSSPDNPQLLQDIKRHQQKFQATKDKIPPFLHPSPFKLIAKLLQFSAARNIRSILTVSLPRAQLAGYFDIAVDNLPMAPAFLLPFLEDEISIIATSDISRAKETSQIASNLRKPFLLLQRINDPKIFHMATDEYPTKDSHILFIDEMSDRVFQAAQQIKELSNCQVSLLLIHLFLEDPDADMQKIQSDTIFNNIYMTNSIRIPDKLAQIDKVKVIDLSEYLAESIKCIHEGKSLREMISFK